VQRERKQCSVGKKERAFYARFALLCLVSTAKCDQMSGNDTIRELGLHCMRGVGVGTENAVLSSVVSLGLMFDSKRLINSLFGETFLQREPTVRNKPGRFNGSLERGSLRTTYDLNSTVIENLFLSTSSGRHFNAHPLGDTS
jgi:hypothetical protein